MDNPCFFCGGAAHPATGHAYSERVLACRRCTLEAFSWVKGHTNKKASGKKHAKTALSFYEAAVLKIEPPVDDLGSDLSPTW